MNTAIDGNGKTATSAHPHQREHLRIDPVEFALSDIGNAERFIHEHGEHFRHVARWNRDIVWDGKRWHLDEIGLADQLAKMTVRRMKDEANDIADKNRSAELWKHAHRTENNRKVKDLLERARKEAGVTVLPDILDTDPWALNVGNGTIDLRTGDLRPHRREDFLTKLVPIDYNPDAQAPTFARAIDEIFDHNPKLVAFMRRAVGYSLTGIVSERCLFINWGSGHNGKSTVMAAFQHVFGEYAIQANADLLMARRPDTIPNDIARLKGARFVSAIETDDGRRLAEATVKQMTGGEDSIAARFLHGEFFDFKPTFHLWMATNHKPIVHGTDAAIWERIKLIPYTVFFPEDTRDKQLGEKLRAEQEGILAWMVMGALEWRETGLGVPDEVRTATSEYRAAMDVVADFIDERCLVGDRMQNSASAIYADYRSWSERAGEKPISQKRFGNQLAERGFRRSRDVSNRATWLGIDLATGGSTG